MPKGIPKKDEVETVETTPEVPSDKVMVSKDTLARLEVMIQEQTDKVALLEKIANKTKLENARDKGPIGKSIRIGLFRVNSQDDPKVVTGWYTVANHARYTLGKEDVDQRIMLILENGEETVEIPYETFYNKIESSDQIELDLDKTKFNYDPKTGARRDLSVAVLTYNDKEYSLPAYAVNPR